jgi:dTMP kinase
VTASGGGPKGLLIALEGGEGSGKTTQAGLLAAALGAVATREPGGTAVGERIRDLVLDRSLGDLGPHAELLLMAAARAEHVRQVIAPALASGRTVVTDRFSGSSLAYQGYGRGLAPEVVEAVSSAATGGVEPDLNVLIDVPDSVAAERRCGSPDRIEAAAADFHARVTEGFRRLAAARPDRWAVVDGGGTIDEVAARVLATVAERLGVPAPAGR